MSAIVHYIKHWDNDTKGSISFFDDEIADLAQAISFAERDLTKEAHQALTDGEWELSTVPVAYTITKAEFVAESAQSYTGVPKATF